MADQKITELPIKTSSGMTATDYLLGIDSSEGYQMLIADLGNYIINNVAATLAGSSQTLASAISWLQTNSIGMMGTANIDNMHTDETCGVYWINNTATEVTGTKPGIGQGIFIVKKQTTKYYRQVYLAVTAGGEYVGRYYNTQDNTWTSWANIRLADVAFGAHQQNYAYMTAIATNNDLNSFINPGSYYCPSNTMAATLGHYPAGAASSGFVLHVEQFGGGTGAYVYQTFINRATEVEIFTRWGSKSGSTISNWSEWVKVPTRAEIDALGAIKQVYNAYDTTGISGTTKTLTLGSGRAYLLTIGNVNTTSETSGIYLIVAQTNASNIIALHEAGASVAVVSVSNLTLSIEYKKNYVLTSLIRIGG